MQFVRVAVEASSNAGSHLLLRQGMTLALATILRPAHLDALQPWPRRHGGGKGGAGLLIARVCGLLATPFALAKRRQGAVQQLQEVSKRHRLEPTIEQGCRACREDFISIKCIANNTVCV